MSMPWTMCPAARVGTVYDDESAIPRTVLERSRVPTGSGRSGGAHSGYPMRQLPLGSRRSMRGSQHYCIDRQPVRSLLPPGTPVPSPATPRSMASPIELLAAPRTFMPTPVHRGVASHWKKRTAKARQTTKVPVRTSRSTQIAERPRPSVIGARRASTR